ncbi:hypothetical protein HUU05_14195 [candidate division KSB1 bacterium]|nr:hypothetical protein [candidate division KSB1 bacterium]
MKKTARAMRKTEPMKTAAVVARAVVAGGKKASSALRLGETEREAGEFSGPPPEKPAAETTAGREPLEKMMMRLPRSLAREFHKVYLALAARHLEEQGEKLLLQDCHIEMVREWLARQKELLAS